MKTNLSVFLIFLSMSIAACGPSEQSSSNKEKFNAYLKHKRISVEDTERVERVRKEYERRGALVSAIADTNKLDKAVVAVELEEFRREMMISRYFDHYLKEAVTDQGLQNFYSQNIDQYKSRRVKVSHILFRTNPRMDQTERDAALTQAREAYSQINAGAAFEELAKEVSQDKVSGDKGGSLGWINEGAISEAFSAKVFEMQAGAVSEPFATDFGFHIVRVDEAAQELTKSFDAVKGDLRYQLRNQAKQAEMQRLLKAAGYSAPNSATNEEG